MDVLVCGGGMSGMACASFAAQAGAKVLVVEKQDCVGGSSAYSAGMLYVALLVVLWRNSDFDHQLGPEELRVSEVLDTRR